MANSKHKNTLIKSKNITLKEKQLLFSLRTKSYNVKNNFKNRNKGNLNCHLGCNSLEEYLKIYGSVTEQTATIKKMAAIDYARICLIDTLSPGRVCGQDP